MILASALIDPAKAVETKDALQHLRDAGFSKLLDALARPGVYTRGRRVKYRALARQMRVGPKAAKRLLHGARQILQGQDEPLSQRC